MYFMSDPQALHVTRNVIPGKLGVDLHLHRVHIPLVPPCIRIPSSLPYLARIADYSRNSQAKSLILKDFLLLARVRLNEP